MVTARKNSIRQKLSTYTNTPIRIICWKFMRRSYNFVLEYFYLPKLQKSYKGIKFGSHALQKCFQDLSFNSVLDIGCGEGLHTEFFLEKKYDVTAIDFGDSVYFSKNKQNMNTIVADFNRYDFDRKFDLIWCSHVLEHQLNVQTFLRKIHSITEVGGSIVVTVPPFRNTIVGGHLTQWNAGLLLYNLVLAGFDCKKASVLKYGYNISVIAQKTSKIIDLSSLQYDVGDIRLLKKWLPDVPFFSNDYDDPFNGNILKHNW